MVAPVAERLCEHFVQQVVGVHVRDVLAAVCAWRPVFECCACGFRVSWVFLQVFVEYGVSEFVKKCAFKLKAKQAFCVVRGQIEQLRVSCQVVAATMPDVDVRIAECERATPCAVGVPLDNHVAERSPKRCRKFAHAFLLNDFVDANTIGGVENALSQRSSIVVAR